MSDTHGQCTLHRSVGCQREMAEFGSLIASHSDCVAECSGIGKLPWKYARNRKRRLKQPKRHRSLFLFPILLRGTVRKFFVLRNVATCYAVDMTLIWVRPDFNSRCRGKSGTTSSAYVPPPPKFQQKLDIHHLSSPRAIIVDASYTSQRTPYLKSCFMMAHIPFRDAHPFCLA